VRRVLLSCSGVVAPGSSGKWEGATRGKLLRRPNSLGGGRGQKGRRVVPLGFLNGFEVGQSGRPCRGLEGGFKSVSLGGAEGGVVSSPQL